MTTSLKNKRIGIVGLVVLCIGLTGCSPSGATARSDLDDAPSSSSVTDDTETFETPTPTPDPGIHFSIDGTFTDGYTANVDITLTEPLNFETSIINAKPGYVDLISPLETTGVVTNTTPGRVFPMEAVLIVYAVYKADSPACKIFETGYEYYRTPPDYCYMGISGVKTRGYTMAVDGKYPTDPVVIPAGGCTGMCSAKEKARVDESYDGTGVSITNLTEDASVGLQESLNTPTGYVVGTAGNYDADEVSTTGIKPLGIAPVCMTPAYETPSGQDAVNLYIAESNPATCA